MDLPATVKAALDDPDFPRPWALGTPTYGRWEFGIYSEVDGIKRYFYGSNNFVYLNDIIDYVHKQGQQ
jgi:hypothetical protein